MNRGAWQLQSMGSQEADMSGPQHTYLYKGEIMCYCSRCLTPPEKHSCQRSDVRQSVLGEKLAEQVFR